MKGTMRWVFLLAVVLALAGCGRRAPDSPAMDGLTVRFLDVGQGDATLIQWDGGAALVDAGPRDHERELVRALRAHGVRRLNLAVATHPDSDHIGGFGEILRHIPVDLFIHNGFNSGSPMQAYLLRELKRRRVRTDTAAMGDTFRFPDLEMRILSPMGRLSGTGSDDNNNSIAVLVIHHDTRLMVLGDLETAGRGVMLGYNMDTRAGILKLAHHGSADGTDKDLLDAVRPRHAVVSCERGNPYGHPHREPLAALRARGVKLYRTDLQGTVTARSDGTAWTFETERPAGREQWLNGNSLK